MYDDQIRHYVRAKIEKTDPLILEIIDLANNHKEISLPGKIRVTPLDLSLEGVRFLCAYKLIVGIKLKLRLTIGDKVVLLVGKILRMDQAEDQFEYALRFQLQNEFNKVIINNFIKKKTVDQIRQLRS